MNNIDKLRNIIIKEQKLLHPYGQGIMGVVHAFNQNESKLREYIQRISKYLTLNVDLKNLVYFRINTIIIIFSISR